MTIEIERVFGNFVLLRIYKDATRLTSNMRKIGIGSKDGVTKYNNIFSESLFDYP